MRHAPLPALQPARVIPVPVQVRDVRIALREGPVFVEVVDARGPALDSRVGAQLTDDTDHPPREIQRKIHAAWEKALREFHANSTLITRPSPSLQVPASGQPAAYRRVHAAIAGEVVHPPDPALTSSPPMLYSNESGEELGAKGYSRDFGVRRPSLHSPQFPGKLPERGKLITNPKRTPDSNWEFDTVKPEWEIGQSQNRSPVSHWGIDSAKPELEGNLIRFHNRQLTPDPEIHKEFWNPIRVRIRLPSHVLSVPLGLRNSCNIPFATQACKIVPAFLSHAWSGWRQETVQHIAQIGVPGCVTWKGNSNGIRPGVAKRTLEWNQVESTVPEPTSSRVPLAAPIVPNARQFASPTERRDDGAPDRFHVAPRSLVRNVEKAALGAGAVAVVALADEIVGVDRSPREVTGRIDFRYDLHAPVATVPHQIQAVLPRVDVALRPGLVRQLRGKQRERIDFEGPGLLVREVYVEPIESPELHHAAELLQLARADVHPPRVDHHAAVLRRRAKHVTETPVST
eukprot:gene7446-biopygen3704